MKTRGCKMKKAQLIKEDVRQLAIDFQMNWENMSLLELSDARDGFEYLGKIYGLTDEFIEEGIL